MRSGRGARAGRWSLAALTLVVLVLGLAQALLPGIAADRISSKLGRYGKVERVSVSAWPAVKLLWGDADSVHVRARALTISPARVASLLAEADGAARMDVSVREATLDSVALQDAMLRKRGPRLSAEATITGAAVAAALPGMRVALLPGSAGTVRVRVGASLFGLSGSVDAVAGASSGALVVAPEGSLFGALHLTLFADPRVYLEAVGARRVEGSPPAYRLSLTGRLR